MDKMEIFSLFSKIPKKASLKTFRTHVISRLTYGSPIWAHSLSFQPRSKIRSVYLHIIQITVKDFEFKLNRSLLLEIANQESVDGIKFRRASVSLIQGSTILNLL